MPPRSVQDAAQVCRRLRPEAEPSGCWIKASRRDDRFPSRKMPSTGVGSECPRQPDGREADGRRRSCSQEQICRRDVSVNGQGTAGRNPGPPAEIAEGIPARDQESMTQEDWEHSRKPMSLRSRHNPPGRRLHRRTTTFSRSFAPGRSTAVPQQPKAEPHAANTAGSRPFPDDVTL